MTATRGKEVKIHLCKELKHMYCMYTIWPASMSAIEQNVLQSQSPSSCIRWISCIFTRVVLYPCIRNAVTARPRRILQNIVYIDVVACGIEAWWGSRTKLCTSTFEARSHPAQISFLSFDKCSYVGRFIGGHLGEPTWRCLIRILLQGELIANLSSYNGL